MKFTEFADIVGSQISLLHRQKSTDPAFPSPAASGGKTSYWWRVDAETYRDYRRALRESNGSDVKKPRYSRRKAAVVDSKRFAQISGLALSSVNMYRLSDPAFPEPAIPGRYPYWWERDARNYRASKPLPHSTPQPPATRSKDRSEPAPPSSTPS